MKKESYNLREKERKTIFEQYNVDQYDLQDDGDSDRGWNRRRLRPSTKSPRNQDFDYLKDE